MAYLQRLMPQSLSTQITGLVAVSVLLGITLLVAILWFVFDLPARDDDPIFAAGRLVEAIRLLQAAGTPTEADALLDAIRRSGLEVRRVGLTDLVATGSSALSHIAIRAVAMHPEIEVLNGLRDPTGSMSQLVVKLDEEHGLVFNLVLKAWPILMPPTALLLMTVALSMLLLSAYAVRWVVAPLAEVANAATSFGRSPQAHDALSRRGPREIIQVIDALNEMRTDLRQLLDDRTRMLAAISHDLRTPLTRLRLRAERIDEDVLRTTLLRDLIKMSRMLNDTLDYLRDDARPEPLSQVDLPSLLQTICSDFSDVGHAVSYVGLHRFSYACHPRALSRAVTNVVENAVKHGNTVSVALGITAHNAVEVEILDDGPGIPASLREKVFQPFFKVDDARSENHTGFGLGLSIAQEIVKRHGGDIEMHRGEPVGLRVLVRLPSKVSVI